MTCSFDDIVGWVRNVREKSPDYIDFLSEDDFHRVPSTSGEGLRALNTPCAFAVSAQTTSSPYKIPTLCSTWMIRIM